MSRNEGESHAIKATDEEILALFSFDDRPFQTARAVAEAFDLDRSQAYRRLQDLANEGFLEKSKVGGRAVVWWISDDSKRSRLDGTDVNPDDPIFARTSFEAGEPTNTSERIDDLLYDGFSSEFS